MTCPVLAFTPATESALRWFDSTYELTEIRGRVVFRRTELPGPGGVGDQDARLMDALEVLRRVHDDLMAPRERTK